MNPQPPPTKATLSPATPSATILHGHWLVIARVVWAILVLLTLGVFAASLPMRYAELRTVVDEAGPATRFADMLRLHAEDVPAIQQLGLSIDFLAVYGTALAVVLVMGFTMVALVIFWHKPDDWMALLVSLALVTISPFFAFTLDALARIHPGWRLPVSLVLALGFASNLIAWYLFPDGRFAPRWTRGLALAWAIWAAIWIFIPAANFLTWPILPALLAALGLVGTLTFAQVYRYRYISSMAQREQTKWCLFGAAMAPLVASLLTLTQALVPTLRQPGLPSVLFKMAAGTAFVASMLLVPLAVGISILRYRLWDIDVLVNRTLVYGTLTAALTLIYIGCVVLLQTIAGVFTNLGHSELVTVASTLAIAALFTPLRRRIQNIIDRRFYRRTYDAAQVLAAFSTRLRDEVDLNALTDELLVVVAETMQPAHVSLWLRPTEPEVRR